MYRFSLKHLIRFRRVDCILSKVKVIGIPTTKLINFIMLKDSYVDGVPRVHCGLVVNTSWSVTIAHPSHASNMTIIASSASLKNVPCFRI